LPVSAVFRAIKTSTTIASYSSFSTPSMIFV